MSVTTSGKVGSSVFHYPPGGQFIDYRNWYKPIKSYMTHFDEAPLIVECLEDSFSIYRHIHVSYTYQVVSGCTGCWDFPFSCGWGWVNDLKAVDAPSLSDPQGQGTPSTSDRHAMSRANS